MASARADRLIRETERLTRDRLRQEHAAATAFAREDIPRAKVPAAVRRLATEYRKLDVARDRRREQLQRRGYEVDHLGKVGYTWQERKRRTAQADEGLANAREALIKARRRVELLLLQAKTTEQVVAAVAAFEAFAQDLQVKD